MTFYYSKTTNIFYAKHKNKLYRFDAHYLTQAGKTKKKLNIQWVESEFQNYDGTAESWTKATRNQIEIYDLEQKFKKIVDQTKGH